MYVCMKYIYFICSNSAKCFRTHWMDGASQCRQDSDLKHSSNATKDFLKAKMCNVLHWLRQY